MPGAGMTVTMHDAPTRPTPPGRTAVETGTSDTSGMSGAKATNVANGTSAGKIITHGLVALSSRERLAWFQESTGANKSLWPSPLPRRRRSFAGRIAV